MLSGRVLTLRLIVVIKARQREESASWVRNDRLLAVATHADTHAHVKDLDKLWPRLLDEIERSLQPTMNMNVISAPSMYDSVGAIPAAATVERTQHDPIG